MAGLTALPILSNPRQSGADGADGDGGAGTPSGRAVGDRPRRKIISAACDCCRKKKTRCNGIRPTCSACVNRGSLCVYDVEAGETRVQSLKSKNQSLENSLSTFLDACCQLQSDSQEEVEAAVQYIRNDPQFRATMEAGMRSLGRDFTSNEEKPSAVDDRRALTFVPDDLDESIHIMSRRGTNQTARDDRTMVNSRMDPLVDLPDQQVALAAVMNFYNCSGKLFHSFPQDVGLSILREVYSGGRHNAPVSLAQLFGIMAVGCQYAHDSESATLGAKSYHIAKSFLETALEEDSLQATRVIACLAIYNVMDKSTVALSYIEQGLGILSRYGIDQTVQPSGLKRALWKEMRRVWRTHVFLQSWLTSSLGFVLKTSTAGPSRDILAHLHIDTDPSGQEPFDESVQAEMAKAAVLTARVVRILFETPSLSDAKSVDSTMDEVHSWFNGLRPEMRPERLSTMDMHAVDTVACYFIHLLYHGAIILTYRRILSDGADRASSPSIGLDSRQRALAYQEQGLDAARSSAQIVRVLLEAQVVSKRCWLVIYHSFASALVIMNHSAHKLLAHAADLSTRDDLDLAYHCVRLLAYAAELDPVAEQFFSVLAPLYDAIVGNLGDRTLPLAVYLLNIARHSDFISASRPSDIQHVAQTLSDLTCKPFGDNGLPQQDDLNLTPRNFTSQIPHTFINPATITSHPASIIRSASRASNFPILDAHVPQGAEFPTRKPQSYSSTGSAKHDTSSPSNRPPTFHSNHAPRHRTPQPDATAVPMEETAPVDPGRTSIISSSPHLESSLAVYDPPASLPRLGWSAPREANTRPFAPTSSDSAPFGTRNLLQVDQSAASWANKRRRVDLELDSTPGSSSNDSRRPSGGDSGYASASRGYGSISSVGRGSISAMSEGRRESAFSEPARRESVFSEGRRESVMSQGRRESMLPPTRRRESWFAEATEPNHDPR